MKASVVGALLEAALSWPAAASSSSIDDRDVDETYPYKGPEVPVGDWVDPTINGNGKGFKRIIEPPAVQPASENPTNNINVVSLSYFPKGINVHFQTPFGLDDNASVRWGKSADSLVNIATGNTHTYDRTPPCSIVKPVTQCSQFFHDVRISGLDAGSTYYYQILASNGTTESDILSFTTAQAAGDDRAFTFGVLNDMGYTNAGDTNRELQKAVDEGIAFAIHGGDLSYADDWNAGILACDNTNDGSVCYAGPDSNLPGDGPIPDEYLDPLPEGENPNTGSPRGGDASPIYETNWDIWQQWISNITTKVPYMVLPGNHEASCGHHEDANNVTSAYLNSNQTNSTAPEKDLNYWSCPPSQRNFTAYQHRFTMPGDLMGGAGNFWYSYDYGLVHFVFIDTETDYPNSAEKDFAMDVDELDYDHPKPSDTDSTDGGPFGAVTGDIHENESYEQLQWLEKDLAAVDRAVTPWVVVMGHRPLYSSQISGYQKNIRNAFESTLIKHNADIYVAGHIHWYERLLPLGLNGTINHEAVVDSSTYYASPGSITHITNGAAGNVQSHSTLGDDTILEMTQILDLQHYGFLKAAVHNETVMTIRYIFAEDGSVGDELTVLKSSGHGNSTGRPTSTATATHSGPYANQTTTATGAVVITTEIVTAYTTWCPAATTITQGSHTYTVTEPTTLTITDCPCTLTHTKSVPPHNTTIPAHHSDASSLTGIDVSKATTLGPSASNTQPSRGSNPSLSSTAIADVPVNVGSHMSTSIAGVVIVAALAVLQL